MSTFDSSFSNVEQLTRAFLAKGCSTLIVKVLAANQDNDKNQVYLGMDDSLLGMLPGKLEYSALPSSSQKKRHSAPGIGIETLHIDFRWLWPDGRDAHAPHAKLIYYFQYPELRFSGFLRGCPRGPSALRRNYQDDYGHRALIMGVNESTVYGTVVTDRDSPALLSYLSSLPHLDAMSHGVLRTLSTNPDHSGTNLEQLITELGRCSERWWPAQYLANVEEGPVLAGNQQASGWTLESLLGIPRNSIAGPDKLGFEIKALASHGPLSITTTEPDFGYRKDHTLTEFLTRFGWPGMRNDGSLRFNGRHDTKRVYAKSEAKVFIENWSIDTNGPDGQGEPRVVLLHVPTGEVMAGWSFDVLANKWAKKHSGCIYVEYERFPGGRLHGEHPSHYLYGPWAYCGIGTSINRLIGMLAKGLVYLDPGDRVLADGNAKKRMQWRMSGSQRDPLSEQLSHLYAEWRPVRIGNNHDEISSTPPILRA